MDFLKEIEDDARQLVIELLSASQLKKGDMVVVGCSSSEVMGEHIGKGSSPKVAKAIFDGIFPELAKRGIFLAAQGCEHINRSLVIEREALRYNMTEVNVVPQLHAGGSFSVECYNRFKDPIMVEAIQVEAGIDIGDTFIGMHLKPVAVPVRTGIKSIGKAHITCARTRPKFVGGKRAEYDMKLAGGKEVRDK